MRDLKPYGEVRKNMTKNEVVKAICVEGKENRG